MEEIAPKHPEEKENPHTTREGMIKPLASWLIAAGTFWGWLCWLIPKFKEVFLTLAKPLPGPLHALVSLSDFLNSISGMALFILLFTVPIVQFVKAEKRRPFRIFFYTAGLLALPGLLVFIIALFFPLIPICKGMSG